jgi:RNA polymerase sigma-70 factor, ECF subfamily
MNEQEFNQKVMVYSGKFYGYSYKILGDKEEARDAVQDLYVKLWSLRHHLSNINSIEAFGTTIIRNLCIDRLKRIKSSSMHSENLVKLSLIDDSNTFDGLDNEKDIRIDLVRWAIKKLPDLQQKVFLMRDFEEKEYEIISLELGISPENVRVMLSRARKRVRELIESSKKVQQ